MIYFTVITKCDKHFVVFISFGISKMSLICALLSCYFNFA